MVNPSKKLSNPFYVLVLLAGIAFAVTACAYGVMTVKELRRDQAIEEPTSADSRFSEFVDRNGPTIMFAELAVLALFTFASISLDQYFTVDRESARTRACQDPVRINTNSLTEPDK